MKKTQDKVAASVTVYQVADMTTKGRKAVCGWLRKLADDLQREPESFAKTFRARYLYSPNRSGAIQPRRKERYEFRDAERRVDGRRSRSVERRCWNSDLKGR